jgi:nickel-dependent lactate racemase
MNTRDDLREIVLPYGEREILVRLPARALRAVLTPRPASVCADPAAEVRRALASPIGMKRLVATARGARRVVIIADDLTRRTPVDVILPLLLDELQAGGIRPEQVRVLIALGTHRPMSQAEIDARFGLEITREVPVINHRWQDPARLADLGVTPNGTPIRVSRLAVEADLLIGLGSIVPHHIPGYSGGAKIVQPGICGPTTTGATHTLSIRAARSYLGSVENPVRAEMEAIGERVGLKAVLNTVLDPAGRLVRAFFGQPHAAFRAGAALARQVYGIPLAGQADIVVAGSHPCDIEFWQAHKSLYPADLAVRDGGTIIVVTPAPEGVSVTHRSMLSITALDAGEIERLIEQSAIDDMVGGALALAWAKIRQRASISLVSDGISDDEARALGFTPFGSLDEALAAALRRHGPGATVAVLTHAPETLPILTP